MAARAFCVPLKLEHFFSRKLGTPIRLRVETYRSFESDEDEWASRRRAHRWSRAVLGRMMTRTNEGGVFHARRLRFPQPSYSISHCGATIVCATTTDCGIRGLGVDLELDRPIPPSADRLYLSGNERISLKARSKYSNTDLLRLWTVKEALFKADMDNRKHGWLACYECLDPCRSYGRARLRVGPVGKSFKFASVRFQSGFLTVAISDGRRV